MNIFRRTAFLALVALCALSTKVFADNTLPAEVVYKAKAEMLQFSSTQMTHVELVVYKDGRWSFNEVLGGDKGSYAIASGTSWESERVTNFPELQDRNKSLLSYCANGPLDSAVADLNKSGCLLLGSAVGKPFLAKKLFPVGFFFNNSGDWLVVQTEMLIAL